jgi:hypothetical protein
LEDQVPESHLLRLIEKHISFAFVRKQLKDSYRETGRPSIDPETKHMRQLRHTTAGPRIVFLFQWRGMELWD